MSWLALDIGGAKLKAADGLGFAASRPFAVWRAPERLSAELAELLSLSPSAKCLAVTMTAELADCYETKAAGVQAILDAVAAAAGGSNVVVYLTDGRMVPPDVARRRPTLAAASNWHALATFANRLVNAWPALLLDLGSTTTDVIPLSRARLSNAGVTDAERLMSGELVYTGVERTPASAVVRSLPWRGNECPVAAELFATTMDAYVLLGEAPQDSRNVETADGRPRTVAHAQARLARMICADTEEFSLNDARLGAAAIRDAQLALVSAAVAQVVAKMGETPKTIICSGQGEFLLRALIKRFNWPAQVVSLTDYLGPEVSRCAPAHALAVLAREWAKRNGE
jgi:probable H4MPT-linked C1 transfer pathway protein